MRFPEIEANAAPLLQIPLPRVLCLDDAERPFGEGAFRSPRYVIR